jgi:hypothetical protein
MLEREYRFDLPTTHDSIRVAFCWAQCCTEYAEETTYDRDIHLCMRSVEVCPLEPASKCLLVQQSKRYVVDETDLALRWWLHSSLLGHQRCLDLRRRRGASLAVKECFDGAAQHLGRDRNGCVKNPKKIMRSLLERFDKVIDLWVHAYVVLAYESVSSSG